MNKSQFIEALAAHYEGNKRAASKALDSVVDTISREVAKGEKVAITGFGAFEKSIRPSRMVRNPATGERVRAKKTAVPKFRAGAELKAVVSGAKKLPKLSVAKTTSTGRSSSAAKSSAAKSSAAKSSAAKKASSTRSPVKKTTAKKSAPASTAKKSGTKKTAASKRTAATSTSRKTSPTRSTAKKSTAKKSTAKRAAKKG